MGKRNKLKRFGDLKNFENVFDADLGFPQDWKEISLPAGRSVILEVGCGKGAYTTGLAEIFADKNFVGIDVKGERVWVGAKNAKEKNLRNVFFIRGRVNDLEEYFSPKSISEIWITFPDPFPREKQSKHRLTSPIFLEKYKKILVPGGKVHLKTDDQTLYEYSVETLQHCGGKILAAKANIYMAENIDAELHIQTDFEKKHLAKGKKIFYLKIKF